MNLNRFVENVKILSKEKGMSPTSVCVEAGLSRAFLTDITNKKTNPRIDSIFALSQYLGVTVSELLGETPNPTSVSDLDTAYARAPKDVQTIVDLALKPYKS